MLPRNYNTLHEFFYAFLPKELSTVEIWQHFLRVELFVPHLDLPHRVQKRHRDLLTRNHSATFVYCWCWYHFSSVYHAWLLWLARPLWLYSENGNAESQQNANELSPHFSFTLEAIQLAWYRLLPALLVALLAVHYCTMYDWFLDVDAMAWLIAFSYTMPNE